MYSMCVFNLPFPPLDAVSKPHISIHLSSFGATHLPALIHDLSPSVLPHPSACIACQSIVMMGFGKNNSCIGALAK